MSCSVTPAAVIMRATNSHPGVQIIPGIPHHGRLADGAAGGVDADQLLRRDREQAERITLVKILLLW